MEKITAGPLRLLTKGLEEVGIEPEERLVEAFFFYLEELMKWNRAYNITSITRPEEIIQKHFLDSLLYLPFVEEFSTLRSFPVSVADVGSGGGFPGLVLKIVLPPIEMHLIEPSRKKAAFLKHMCYRLQLENLVLHQQRVEDLSIKVDIAISRALFKIKDFIKRVSPIVREGGILVLNKGPEVQKELEKLKGRRTSKGEVEVFERILPTTNIKRYLLVVKL